MEPRVAAVARGTGHGPGKDVSESIRLVAGIGVEGDVHAGETVKHRSRVRRDASQPNLRQVHLIQAELHDELRGRGFEVRPGEMGENVTTAGIDLLALPRGSRLRLGEEAVIEVTGLRNPCTQLNGIAAGLMDATLERDAKGELIRKAGVMAIGVEGGQVGGGRRDRGAAAAGAASPTPTRLTGTNAALRTHRVAKAARVVATPLLPAKRPRGAAAPRPPRTPTRMPR